MPSRTVPTIPAPLVVALGIVLAAAACISDTTDYKPGFSDPNPPPAPPAPPPPPLPGYPLDAPASDVVFDAARNRLYITQPTLFQVAVFRLSDARFLAPIPTGPNRPTGLDMSVTGDSLIVALPEAKALGIIDLTQSPVAFDTVRLVIDNYLNRRPAALKVLATGKVIVAITFSGSGYGGQILEYDLATGAQQVRGDVGVGGRVTDLTRLARAGTRQQLLVVMDNSCCPLSGTVYDAATDQFAPALPTVNSFNPSVSANQDGSRFLIGTTVFSGTLGFLQQYVPPGHTGVATALNPDASRGYFSVPGGVIELRLSDGAVTRTFATEAPPVKLFPLPDGSALIAFTPARMHVFGLGT